jgi:RNA polymerase sigma-70 factor (ECF subfamily)
MENDGQLVGRVLAGQREAYADLVRRHERAMLAAAAQVLGDVQTAQDAVQEALVLAFRKLATLRKADAFGPWAIRIARRAAGRIARRRRRDEPLSAEPAAESPPLDGQWDERIRLVLGQVMRLPDKQRQAVLLKYFAGHDAEQIAQVTGQTAGTVRMQLFRALSRLRERLKEPGL